MRGVDSNYENGGRQGLRQNSGLPIAVSKSGHETAFHNVSSVDGRLASKCIFNLGAENEEAALLGGLNSPASGW